MKFLVNSHSMLHSHVSDLLLHVKEKYLYRVFQKSGISGNATANQR